VSYPGPSCGRHVYVHTAPGVTNKDVARTLRAVVQFAFPRGIAAREKVRFSGEVTADHDRLPGTTDPRIGNVRQVGTSER